MVLFYIVWVVLIIIIIKNYKVRQYFWEWGIGNGRYSLFPNPHSLFNRYKICVPRVYKSSYPHKMEENQYY